jgi:hypothetical protein
MHSSPLKDNLFLHFTTRFDQIGLPYMISGSVAAMIYGEPRMTNDVDIIAHFRPSGIGELLKVFQVPEFYIPPADVLAVETSRTQRGHFNIIHMVTGFKCDIYVRGNDPLHAWALDRTRRVAIGEYSIPLAPAEYVIVRKLEYFREGGSQKHLTDIIAISRNSAGFVDQAVLKEFIAERGLLHEWEQVKLLEQKTS